MRFNVKFMIVCFLFIFQNKGISQQTETIAAVEKKSLEGYFYKEVVENADASAKNLPLVIALHWMRSTPDEFSAYVKGFRIPVRILLLEGPYPAKEGYSFYPVSPKSYYKMSENDKMEAFLAESKKLSLFITAATKLYAPAKKPAIIGASQGGDLSFIIGLHYNNLISLSCPLLATIDDRLIMEWDPVPAPIIAFHGMEDPIVKVDTIKKLMEKAKDDGYKTELHLYDGVKHDISDQMKSDYIDLISKTLTNSGN